MKKQLIIFCTIFIFKKYAYEKLFILLTILTIVSCQDKSKGFESIPGKVISKNEIESNQLLDFYLADIYTDTTNFVKFVPISTINEKGVKEFYYKCFDKRYESWLVIFNPAKKDKQQWLIKNPQNEKEPIGGGYCITVRCYCSTWGWYIVSCYSNCTEDTCCQSFLNFKKC
jgi:hypothetical protein